MVRPLPAISLVAVFLVTALPVAGPAAADCTCRYRGASLPLGEVVCMEREGAQVLTQCRMAQNVTNWEVIAGSCTSAAGGAPAFAAIRPVHHPHARR